MEARKGPARVSATAPTGNGWVCFSGPLTPYEVETLYDQIASLRRPTGHDVHVDVELGGTPRNSPELRSLARRMKRLERHGVVVHVHARRPRRPSS